MDKDVTFQLLHQGFSVIGLNIAAFYTVFSLGDII